MKSIKQIGVIICLCLTLPLYAQKMVPLTLEIASTPQQITWGLMGRKQLSPNHGMLFVYSYERYLSIWMFNTWIDLSLAFLDGNRRILEIRELKAYPEMMDTRRVIKTPTDLSLYSYNEPIVQFFLKQKVISSYPVKYALEMNKNWFSANNVKVGDVLVLDKNPYFISQD